MNREFAVSLRAGKPQVGSWVSIGHPRVAEIAALLGFDFVVVDTEHTPQGLETVENLVRAVEHGGAVPIVRVPWNDPVRIKRVLDLGVAGVMVPMVETAEEARTAVEAMRYPPDGIRGVAGSRASDYGLDFESYAATADEALVTIVQIETERGSEHAAEIAAVDGVDALFVGPTDLSASLGVLGEWQADTVLETIDRVLEASTVPVGTLAITTEDTERWVARGFDFVISGVDARYLIDGGQAAKSAFEAAVERREQSEG